jgi:hypothetical protein
VWPQAAHVFVIRGASGAGIMGWPFCHCPTPGLQRTQGARERLPPVVLMMQTTAYGSIIDATVPIAAPRTSCLLTAPNEPKLRVMRPYAGSLYAWSGAHRGPTGQVAAQTGGR